MQDDILITNENALAEFREQRFSASAVAPYLQANSVTLINGPPGLGKSTLIDELLDYRPLRDAFELIIVLAGQTANLLERRLVKQPLPGVVRLRPRPRESCGHLDVEWREHERRGTIAFAKKYVCGRCPNLSTCFWPMQYSDGVRGARLVFGTHQQLLLNPRIIPQLRTVTTAERVLLLLDEAEVLAATHRRHVPTAALKSFISVVKDADLTRARVDTWIQQGTLLLYASTNDLKSDDWRFPYPWPNEALAIQEVGLSRDPHFEWLGHRLHDFSCSRPDRRWRDRHGHIVYVSTPYLAESTAIFSAGMPAKYVERQLGSPIGSLHLPFSRLQCLHSGTQFLNLSSFSGAARRFESNHPQILDAFSQLILRNIASRRLTLLITRKRFKLLCIDYLTNRLRKWGHPTKLISFEGKPLHPDDGTTIPVLHYGVAGINAFEDFDAAYCLCGYYIDENVLREAVADVDDDDLRFPVHIRLAGKPPRRRAGTFSDRFRASDADGVIAAYYQQLETNTVLQAVGRVRFATRPREVITFQCSELPGIQLTREFFNLREMREYFGLLTGSDYDRRMQADRARELRVQGMTTRQIAETLGVSERTIRYRLANKGRNHE